jgi:hypothetical protein
MSALTAHAWLRRVSDYHSGSVSATERAAVEAHLAECAECRLALAAYRRLYTLAGSPLRLGDGGASALTEYRPMILEETMLTTDPDTRSAPPWRRPPTRLTGLGAIAAVLAIAVLAASLFAHFRAPTQPVTPHPTPTATPALDPQSQAYVTLLRTYYLPFADADDASVNCWGAVKAAAQANQEQLLATCRSPEAAELALGQTLHTQLAAAAPPARWQAAHATLQQAVDGLLALATQSLAAIDAQDVSRYLDVFTSIENQFCAPIAQLNAGPPPLSPKLYTPNASTC